MTTKHDDHEAAPARAQVVWLWIDHPKCGCGSRRWVAIEGRKWVQLVMTATGEHIRIGLEEFRRFKRPDLTADHRRIATRLKRNAATFGNETVAVKEAIAALRSAPRPPGPGD